MAANRPILRLASLCESNARIVCYVIISTHNTTYGECMGIFILDLDEPQTVDSRLKAVVANIELYLAELDVGKRNDYLITGLAKSYLDEVVSKLNTQPRNKEPSG